MKLNTWCIEDDLYRRFYDCKKVIGFSIDITEKMQNLFGKEIIKEAALVTSNDHSWTEMEVKKFYKHVCAISSCEPFGINYDSLGKYKIDLWILYTNGTHMEVTPDCWINFLR